MYSLVMSNTHNTAEDIMSSADIDAILAALAASDAAGATATRCGLHALAGDWTETAQFVTISDTECGHPDCNR
jgi:hypothetical protein